MSVFTCHSVHMSQVFANLWRVNTGAEYGKSIAEAAMRYSFFAVVAVLSVCSPSLFAGDYSIVINDAVQGDCGAPISESHNVCTSQRVIRDLDHHFLEGRDFEIKAFVPCLVNGRIAFATAKEVKAWCLAQI